MKQFLFTILFLLIVTLNISAQREVYFNTVNPENLNVETLKGVELQVGYNPLEIVSPGRYLNQVPYYAGFFYEKRIAPTMTLGYSGGIFGSTLKIPVYTYDSISGGYFSGYNNSNYQQVYTLGLRVGIEPRWYWNFKKRAEQNRAKLNSGWFLSLPFNYEYSMYTTFRPTYQANSQSYGYMTLKPTIGFRQSISKNIFLEGSFGYGISYGLGTYNGDFYNYLTSANPELKLKAAYTFK